MVTLRTDLRQWLIHDDEAAFATADALDTLAYRIAGSVLAHHEDIELRGVGNFMLRVADVRERRMLGELEGIETTELEQAAIRHIGAVLLYLAGGERPVEALDELHAVVFSIDSQVQSGGTLVPSPLAGLVRGDADGR